MAYAQQHHPPAPYAPNQPQLNDPRKQPMVAVSQVTYPLAYNSIDHHSPPTPANYELTFCQYLESLPMFPLNTVHEAQELQKWTDRYTQSKAAYVSSSDIPLRAKIVDHGISHLSGGGSILPARHFFNAITQNEAQCAKFGTKDLVTVVVTRWAYLPPNERETILVDIVEYRWKLKCTPFYVKHSANEPIKLALVGKTGIKIKAGKQYWKEANFKNIEEASIHSKDGTLVPMVMIRREQRPISGCESKVMRERFEHGWNVPRI